MTLDSVPLFQGEGGEDGLDGVDGELVQTSAHLEKESKK